MKLGKVLIAGAGAVGSVFGGFLRKAGEAVTLLGREDHIRAIEQGGLEITGIWGEHRVEGFSLATDPRELAGRYDTVFLTVKSYDTAAMIRETAPALAPDGVVIAAQNGLGNLEKVAELIGPDRTLGGRVIFGTEITAPGKVRVTVYADRFIIGGYDRAVGRARQSRIGNIVSVLEGSGIPSGSTEEIQPFLWAKILYNCPLNPLGALLDVEYGALGDDPELRETMSEVIREIFSVAEAEGVPLFWDSPEDYERDFYGRLLPPTRSHRASMIADLRRGKPTEIDAMNGWIAGLGKKHGIPTPVNDVLTRIIRFSAGLRGKGGSFFPGSE